jgi:hypothetical protein
MFEDESLKLKLYIYPVLFFVLGTIAMFNAGWEWFGIAMYILGGVAFLHLFIISVIRERRLFVEAEEAKLDKQRRLYETVQQMDGEARYAFGLTYVPQEVLVKKDKTAEVGNELSQTWRKLPLAPYKLKVVAQAALNGEGFTVRKWVGEQDKPGLLTRSEWDAAHESFVDLGMLEQNTTDPRGGFMWTGFGEDVLRQIVKDTL